MALSEGYLEVLVMYSASARDHLENQESTNSTNSSGHVISTSLSESGGLGRIDQNGLSKIPDQLYQEDSGIPTRGSPPPLHEPKEDESQLPTQGNESADGDGDEEAPDDAVPPARHPTPSGLPFLPNLRVSSMPPDRRDEFMDSDELYECSFCGILFKDLFLHALHMHFHSMEDSLICDCGTDNEHVHEFNMHLYTEIHDLTEFDYENERLEDEECYMYEEYSCSSSSPTSSIGTDAPYPTKHHSDSNATSQYEDCMVEIKTDDQRAFGGSIVSVHEQEGPELKASLKSSQPEFLAPYPYKRPKAPERQQSEGSTKDSDSKSDRRKRRNDSLEDLDQPTGPKRALTSEDSYELIEEPDSTATSLSFKTQGLASEGSINDSDSKSERRKRRNDSLDDLDHPTCPKKGYIMEESDGESDELYLTAMSLSLNTEEVESIDSKKDSNSISEDRKRKTDSLEDFDQPTAPKRALTTEESDERNKEPDLTANILSSKTEVQELNVFTKNSEYKLFQNCGEVSGFDDSNQDISSKGAHKKDKLDYGDSNSKKTQLSSQFEVAQSLSTAGSPRSDAAKQNSDVALRPTIKAHSTPEPPNPDEDEYVEDPAFEYDDGPCGCMLSKEDLDSSVDDYFPLSRKRRNIWNSHAYVYECRWCEIVYRCHYVYNYHIAAHTTGDSFRCSCGRHSNIKREFNVHYHTEKHTLCHLYCRITFR